MEAMVQYELLSFLEVYSRYNQIPMLLEDVEKTTFITSMGTYWYNVMPFGLKNVGVMYQRVMSTIFKPLLEAPWRCT